MTSNASPGTRILGSLRSADGAGVVRIEDRYDTGIDDLWSAITDPDRLARWFGEVDGDLSPRGEFRVHRGRSQLAVEYLLGKLPQHVVHGCLGLLHPVHRRGRNDEQEVDGVGFGHPAAVVAGEPYGQQTPSGGLLEPDTEGRLAGFLARHGEGWAATWRDVGERALLGSRPGPLGPESLESGQPMGGPLRLVTTAATIER